MVPSSQEAPREQNVRHGTGPKIGRATQKDHAFDHGRRLA